MLPVDAVGRVGHAEVELAALEGVVGERVAEGDVGRVMALGQQVGLADRVRLRVVLLAVQAQLRVRVLREQVLLRQGKHAAGARGGVVQRADDAGLGQVDVLLGEEQVDQQPDRVPRCVVVAGSLVRGLVELADDVLERIAHVGVGHDFRMQVDGFEGCEDLAQETRLLQSEDLLLEVEVLEHVDIGGEPVDVVGEVVRQPVGVFQQVGERVVRGVVERPPSGLLDLELAPAGLSYFAASSRTVARSGSRMQSRRRRIVSGRITLPYWLGR